MTLRASGFGRRVMGGVMGAQLAVLLAAGGCASTGGQGADGVTAPMSSGNAGERAMAAERVARGFVFFELEHEGTTYPYAVYVPRDYEHGTPTPMILFLHGRGESGDEGGPTGTRQLFQGIGESIMWEPGRWPFVVVMPQKPDYNSQWTDHEAAVMAMVDRAMADYTIDESRVYLTGLSQGGYGTWHLGANHADRFAAIAPICGYVHYPFRDRSMAVTPDDPVVMELASRLEGTPVWVFHGDADDVVPPDNSAAMHAALRARGADVRLSMYPGVNHGSWKRAYGERELPGWFLSHQLGE